MPTAFEMPPHVFCVSCWLPGHGSIGKSDAAPWTPACSQILGRHSCRLPLLGAVGRRAGAPPAATLLRCRVKVPQRFARAAVPLETEAAASYQSQQASAAGAGARKRGGGAPIRKDEGAASGAAAEPRLNKRSAGRAGKAQAAVRDTGGSDDEEWFS